MKEITRRICSDLLLACGCIHIEFLESVIEEVKVEQVWCEEHNSHQKVVKVSEPYRDLGDYCTDTSEHRVVNYDDPQLL